MHRSLRLLVSLLFLVAAPVIFAQSNNEALSVLRFNFDSPGAKSLGMAGAFVGIADDATAAFANPAGLTNLARIEVSLEGRQNERSVPFYSSGLVNRTGGVWDPSGATETNIDASAEGLTFASAVIPIGSRFVATVFQHQLLDFDGISARTGALVFDDYFGAGEDAVMAQREYQVSADVTTIGVAGALRLSDALSLGVGVSRHAVRLEAYVDWYVNDGWVGNQADFVGKAKYARQNWNNADGDETATSATLGLLWKKGNLSLGASHRTKASLDSNVMEFFLTGPDQYAVIRDDPSEFVIPSRTSVGLGYRLGDVLIGFEAGITRRSEQEDSFQVYPWDRALGQVAEVADNFEFEDATEVRLGLEKGFTNLRLPLFVRLGTWYQSAAGLSASPEFIDSVLLPERDSETHLTAGLGLALSRHFEINVGYDRSDDDSITSVSLIGRR